MTNEVLVVSGFAVAEALALRLSQYVLPEFYFSSGSLFVGRAEVKWKAILFRLTIPFTAGLLIALIPIERDYVVAASSGALAWFLVLWPIFWAPGVMVPPVEKGVHWIVALWGFFWAAFTVLPLSGVALMTWIRDVLGDDDSAWWQAEIAGYLFLAIPVALGALLFGRIADREVEFFSDEPDDDEHADYGDYDDEHYMAEEGMESGRAWLAPAPWHVTAALFSVVLMPVLLFGILVAIVFRGRRGRPL
jgi:hypothetical protein